MKYSICWWKLMRLIIKWVYWIHPSQPIAVPKRNAAIFSTIPTLPKLLSSSTFSSCHPLVCFPYVLIQLFFLQIAKIGSELNHNHQKRNSIIFLLTSLVVIILQVTATALVAVEAYRLNAFDIIIFTTYGVTLGCSIIYAGQFILVVCVVRVRFRALNKCFL